MSNKSILEKDIDDFGLSKKTIEKLKDKGITSINNLWILKRTDLKKMGLTDNEINTIIIKLQLNGLDLNKREY